MTPVTTITGTHPLLIQTIINQGPREMTPVTTITGTLPLLIQIIIISPGTRVNIQMKILITEIHNGMSGDMTINMAAAANGWHGSNMK